MEPPLKKRDMYNRVLLQRLSSQHVAMDGVKTDSSVSKMDMAQGLQTNDTKSTQKQIVSHGWTCHSHKTWQVQIFVVAKCLRRASVIKSCSHVLHAVAIHGISHLCLRRGSSHWIHAIQGERSPETLAPGHTVGRCGLTRRLLGAVVRLLWSALATEDSVDTCALTIQSNTSTHNIRKHSRVTFISDKPQDGVHGQVNEMSCVY